MCCPWYDMYMERIGVRKLGAEDRDTLLQMVIRMRQPSGTKAAESAQVAGVPVRAVESWLRKARAGRVR